QNIVEIFPSSAGGWNKQGSAEIYEGDDLFRLIDGGAVLYKEYGFISAAVQAYTNNAGSIIEAEIYEMNDSASAFGIFSLTTLHTGKKTDLSKNAAAGDGFLIFQKGKFYFSLSALEPGDASGKGLFELAREMDSSVTAAGKPALAEKFDGIKDSKIAFIRGNIGLYNLTSFNMGEKFSAGEGIYLEKNDSRSFIFKYSSINESSRNYSVSKQALQNNGKFKLLKKEKDGIILSGNSNYIKYLHLENYLILSISPAKITAEKSAEEISKLLK
ncbi:MAG: DUF6599 family protein, partial [Syntrophothermus sp.]